MTPSLADEAVRGLVTEPGLVTEAATNLTVEDLAKEFRTTPETVHYWVKMGKAPRSFKVGRRRLFARVDVDQWAEAAKQVAV